MKATLYTVTALIAFAANSLFCRMALADGHIDAWSFTILRLLSAAVCLGIIMSIHAYRLRQHMREPDSISHAAILNEKGSWLSSISLVIMRCVFRLLM